MNTKHLITQHGVKLAWFGVTIVACASATAATTNGAATVIYSQGQAQIKAQGQLQPASKGFVVRSGDTVVTELGQAQLRFSDGAYVAVGPKSEYVIEKYIDARNASEDSFASRLLRGSMRAITGLIGKRNKKNYVVRTTTATLGIRGSAFTLQYDDKGNVIATTEQDGIELCTLAGCVGLAAGERAIVRSSDLPPVVTNPRADLPKPETRRDPTLPMEGLDGQGQPSTALIELSTSANPSPTGNPTLQPTPMPSPNPNPNPIMPPEARIYGVTTSSAKIFDVGSTAPYPATVVHLSSGNDPSSGIKTNSDLQVVNIIYPGGDETDSAAVTNSSDVEGYVVSGSVTVDQLTGDATASDDFAYLGRWRAGGSNVTSTYPANWTAMTFVTGTETPLTNAQVLAKDGQGYPQSLTYKLLDNTAQYVSAMRPDGSVDHGAGQITSANLIVDPNAATASVNMNMNMNAYGQRQTSLLSVYGNMYLSPGTTDFSGGSVTMQDCFNECMQYAADANGMLIGPNAERAGLSVGFVHPSFGGVGASAVLDRGANTTP